MQNKKPPFTITEKILTDVMEICELVGKVSSTQHLSSDPVLRRQNRIKTIYSSLAIEQNTLSLEQVTAVLSGKRVLAPPKDIAEVKNAYEIYDHLNELNPYSVEDLLLAHHVMMRGLVQEDGVFRSKPVGVVDSHGNVLHFGTLPQYVPPLVEELLKWTEDSPLPMLIKSCVFHYEFEVIHPFADGNGRMARLWHTVMLYRWRNVFEYIPLESQIERFQAEYYDAIAKCHVNGNSDVFIEFMLSMIDQVLDEVIIQVNKTNESMSEYVKRMLEVMEYDVPYTANAIMEALHLKSKETFRKNYIKPAIELGLIKMTLPEKPNSKNQRYVKQ